MALIQPTSAESHSAMRVHRMRVARGACWTIAFALLGLASLAAVDSAVQLTGWMRGLALSIWSTAFAVLVWYLVVAPWRERWSSSPERAAQRELSGNVKAATAATILLASTLLLALYVPNALERLRRVAVPWHRPSSSHYRIVVTSNDPTVAWGNAVTLSAYLEKLDPADSNPDDAFAVLMDASGTQSTLPMVADESGALHATLDRVTGDFKYRVTVGNHESEWFAVAVIEPVEVTDRTAISVTPPDYASAAIPKQSISGFVPFAAFQFGRADFDFHFSRPAANAFLEWRPETGGSAEVTGLVLSADRTSATGSCRIKGNGCVRLIAVAEKNGKSLSTSTTVPVRMVRDEPPHFERLSGLSERMLAVRPGQFLPIAFAATDDISISRAAIEYVLGGDDSRTATLPIPLADSKSKRVEGRFDFDLPGKLGEGEIVRYRIRLADNRLLAEADLKPQEIVYPETGWATVSVSSQAPPLELQEIEGQGDYLEKALGRAAADVRALAEAAEKLKSDARKGFQIHHKIRLDDSRSELQKIAALLGDANRNADLTPEFGNLSASLRGILESPLKAAAEKLRTAWTENSVQCEAALGDVAQRLREASERLVALRTRTLQLSQARLDCQKVEAAILEQTSLAARLVGFPRVPPEEIAGLQRELIANLGRTIAESPALRRAADELKASEVSVLAGTASELAERLRALTAAIEWLEAEVHNDMLKQFAEDQGRLSIRVGELLPQIELPLRLAGLNSPRLEDFRKLASAIASGKTIDSLTELQRLAEALEEISDCFERMAADRGNIKIASRQLAQWQEDLRTRIVAAKFDALSQESKSAILKEQMAIGSALNALDIVVNLEASTARREAAARIQLACDCLAQRGANAETAMRSAVEALNRLAEKAPISGSRYAKARQELTVLQKDQEAIQKSLEQILKEEVPVGMSFDDQRTWAAKRFAALVPRLRKLSAAVKLLDLPGSERHRTGLLAALAATTADLEAGLRLDAIASLGWVKRELDLLKQIVDERLPQDERIDEFASRLEAMLKSFEIESSIPAKEQLAHLATIQEIQRQMVQLSQGAVPGAAALRFEAQEAIRLAEAAFQSAPKPREARPLLESAVHSLRRLAGRLGGAESEMERIQRLSSYRWLAAKSAEKAVRSGINLAVSEEVRRQLAREAEELLYSRVGASGQPLKQRCLEQYEGLKAKSEPDRYAGLQKSLSDSLLELSGLMADNPELTAIIERPAKAYVPAAPDRYLPSRLFANELRALAAEERTLRERLNQLPEKFAEKLKFDRARPQITLVKRQREVAQAIGGIVLLPSEANAPQRTELIEKAALEAKKAAEDLSQGRLALAKGAATTASDLLRALKEETGDKKLREAIESLDALQRAIVSDVAALHELPSSAAFLQNGTTQVLASAINELAAALHMASLEKAAGDALAPVLEVASQKAMTAAKLLMLSCEKMATGSRADAEKNRREASAALVECATSLAKSAPHLAPQSDALVGKSTESLLQARAAMKAAVSSLAAKEDSSIAIKAMQNAAEAMKVFIAIRTKSAE